MGSPPTATQSTAPGQQQVRWRTRDYDDPTSSTGCGVARVRNCLLRDPLDPSRGTVPASQIGPRTDATVVSQSGNVFTATSGMFFQDYWYDRTCTTCLDEHNGHDDDGLGYHYHLTVSPGGARFVPVFPYIVGPTYAGQLQPSVTYTPTPTPDAGTPVSTFTPTATHTTTTTSTAVVTYVPTGSPTVQTASPTAPPPTVSPTATAPGPEATATGTTTPTPCAINFSDVSSNDYFYKGVTYLSTPLSKPPSGAASSQATGMALSVQGITPRAGR